MFDDGDENDDCYSHSLRVARLFVDVPGYIEFRIGGSRLTVDSVILVRRKCVEFDPDKGKYQVAYIYKKTAIAGAMYPVYDCLFYKKCTDAKAFLLIGFMTVTVNVVDVRGIFTQADVARDMSKIIISEHFDKLPLQYLV